MQFFFIAGKGLKHLGLGLIMLLSFFLASCGQTGPLYLPTDKEKAEK